MDLGPNVFHLQCIRGHMQFLAEMQGHGLKPKSFPLYSASVSTCSFWQECRVMDLSPNVFHLQCIRKHMQILVNPTIE